MEELKTRCRSFSNRSFYREKQAIKLFRGEKE